MRRELFLFLFVFMGVGFVIAIDCVTPDTRYCTDSDGGEVFEVRGVCSTVGLWFGGGSIEDSCSGDVLTEYCCKSSGSVQNCGSKTVSCVNGCSNGACNTVVSCDCGLGNESCNGRDFLNCSDGCNWENLGEVLEKCGVAECNDGVDNDNDSLVDYCGFGGNENLSTCDSDCDDVNDSEAPDCVAGLTSCGVDCVDLTGDDNNCGICGNVCETGLSCISGTCLDIVYNRWGDMNGNFIGSVNVGDYVRFLSNGASPFNVFEGTDGSNIFYGVNERYWVVEDVNSVGYNFSSSSGSSEDLLVVNDDGGEGEFVLDIIDPVCSEFFDVGTTKLISVNASDPDDLITGNISIDGVWKMNFDNTNGSIVNYNYEFKRVGDIQIVVLATNSDGQREKAVSNVMVYDSSNLSSQFYVAACIDSPRNFDRFEDPLVEFDARSSRGLKYNGTVNVIPKESLFFDWKFWLSTNKWGQPCAALGDSHCVNSTGESVWSFVRRFPAVNDNEVYLMVTIPSDVVGSF